jgi:uncharacterized protein (TIGR00290 family)
MRVLVLASGGKDSALASWWAISKGWDVAGLVTVRVENDDSFMFQLQSTNLAAYQSAAMNVGWMQVKVSGKPEQEVIELESSLVGVISGKAGPIPPTSLGGNGWKIPSTLRNIDSGPAIDAIVCGAIRSEYQRRRIELLCERLGVISFTPLWHHDPLQHMQELVSCGFKMMLVSVSSDGLTEEWLGQLLTQESLSALNILAEKFRFSVDGEGGEYETIVTSAPHFNGDISVLGESIWQGRRGEFIITDAKLE